MKRNYRRAIGALIVIGIGGVTLSVAIGLEQASDQNAALSNVPRPPERTMSVPLSAPTNLIEIKSLLKGARAKEAPRSEVAVQPDIYGKLIYVWDNARYEAGGFTSKDIQLVMHLLRKPTDRPRDRYVLSEAETDSPAPQDVSSQEVKVLTDDFVYEPQFSPNGQFVLFKVGNPNSSYGTYTPYILNLKTQSLREVSVPVRRIGNRHRIANRNIAWSRDSRFLSYIQGAVTPPIGGWIPPELHIYDLQTNKNFFVVENEAVLNSVAWTPQNTLLYSVLPKAKPNIRHQKADVIAESSQSENSPPSRPNIYQIPAQGGQPKLLIYDGYRPAPSPDGKWIAFFGSPDARKPQQRRHWSGNPEGEYLLLADHTGKKRRAIQRQSGNKWSNIRWKPDSQSLIIVKLVPSKGMFQARITEYDILSEKERAIGTIGYISEVGMDFGEDAPLFAPLQVSNDGKFLFIRLLQFGKPPNNGLFLKAMNLHDGKVLTLARIGTVRGLDWFDESRTARPAKPKLP